MGGPVPSTLIGVTRIYPVLYRERLSNGGFIVRSERMEAKMIQLYKQREYLQRMPLMLNIFGLTPYLAILEVCLNMNHHTSSRQRKKGSSSDKMKRWQRDRNCSTHNNMLV
ncbi:uncharacterized protein LOC114310896 isoform X3 [Camellia sinensis]|uniref:uncharacterized protein LOC114310896 isoform X3 n=1 Tax=Camellia sinensis TaxID=4442 RepID=UPI0010359EB2|nr:uncharacterized protein LOC114310896 isoform X3 [Camellia sinensis]XP_028112816.1 uncharacterized protein LOC114310896 isoform X3 [Camellia sinensis]XP_028112819.1 uncharacterized protein LOC114310896 isoform X3 [Camellia sinensis]